MRIVAIIMIIACHYAVHGVLQDGIGYLTWNNADFFNRLLTCLLMPGGGIGVALFFMLTGYFKVNSNRIAIRKVCLQTIYYGCFSGVLVLICSVWAPQLLGLSANDRLMQTAKYFFAPVTSGAWWYVTAYIILVLVSPLLNRMIHSMTRKQFLALLIFYWVFWYVLASELARFYDIQKAVFFYLIGAYIRCYTKEISREKVGWYYLSALGCWFVSAICFYLRTVQSVKLETSIENEIVGKIMVRFFNMMEMAFPAVLGAIIIFKIFERMKFTSLLVNRIASTTFGVYLIHESVVIRTLIWNRFFNVNTVQYSSLYYIVCFVITIALIFMFCSLLDFVRIYLFEKRYLQLAMRIEKILKRS